MGHSRRRSANPSKPPHIWSCSSVEERPPVERKVRGSFPRRIANPRKQEEGAAMIFRVFNDEKRLLESPCRDAYRIGNGIGWAIDIERIEDLPGLAGYGGRVEVTIDAEDCRINLVPLETVREEWRARMEAREVGDAIERALRSSDGACDG